MKPNRSKNTGASLLQARLTRRILGSCFCLPTWSAAAAWRNSAADLLRILLPKRSWVWGLALGVCIASELLPRQAIAQEMAAQEAAAQEIAAPKEVNVYSYRQPFLVQPLFEAFTRASGIRVNVVFAQQGMVERIRREGRNSPADVLLTVDIGRLEDAVTAGVVQPVRSATLEQRVPEYLRHPKGLWYGLSVRARVIYASRSRVPEGALTSYADLADPRWKGRICTRSGKHAYNVSLVSSILIHRGEQQTKTWLEGLQRNLARKPQGNDRAQVKAIHEGLCDISLGNSYYMGAMLRDAEQSAWAHSAYLIFPNQQNRGTHVNISGAALARYAPNRAHAQRLLEFLLSELGQRIYAETNLEYPVSPETAWPALLESWGRFRADRLSLEEIASRRSDAVRLLDRVGFE